MKLVEAETKIVEVTDVYGYGIYDYKVLVKLRSVSEDGSLQWDEGEQEARQDIGVIA